MLPHNEVTQVLTCACPSRAAFSAFLRFLLSAANTAARSSGSRLASKASASTAHTHTQHTKMPLTVSYHGAEAETQQSMALLPQVRPAHGVNYNSSSKDMKPPCRATHKGIAAVNCCSTIDSPSISAVMCGPPVVTSPSPSSPSNSWLPLSGTAPP